MNLKWWRIPHIILTFKIDRTPYDKYTKRSVKMVGRLKELIDNYVLMTNLMLDGSKQLGYTQYEIDTYKRFDLCSTTDDYIIGSQMKYDSSYQALGWAMPLGITISCSLYDDRIKIKARKDAFNYREFEKEFAQYLVNNTDGNYTFSTFNFETAKKMIATLELTKFKYIIGVDLAKE